MSFLRRCGVPVLASLLVGAVGCHEVHFEPEVKPGEIELYDNLFAVSLPTEQDAVAVGYRGAIYGTKDGGATWDKRSIQWDGRQMAAFPLLYDVSLADTQRGWIVGQLGTILHTADGGRTWQAQENSKRELGFHLFALHAIDANTAWAVGEWGTRLYTEDGGISWQDRSLLITTTHPQYVWLTPTEQERVRRGEKVFEDVGLNDVYCRPPPSDRCWIVGEFGYIFWSDDRGRNWQRAEIVGTEQIDPIQFPFDSIEVPEEDADRVKEFVELIRPQQHLNILIEPFASKREVAEFVEDGDPGALFDVLDSRAVSVRGIVEETGILSDRLRMRGSPPWDYEDYLDEDPGFLQRYLDSRLAAQPQVTLEVAQNPYLFRVRFTDDMNGVISGLGGVVLVSNDGGLTWRYGDSGTKQAIYALAPRGDRVMAVGEKGLVRVSHDGGLTWQEPTDAVLPDVFTYMRDVEFSPSDQVGMIVGQRGLVLKTDDGGRRWAQVLPPPETETASLQ